MEIVVLFAPLVAAIVVGGGWRLVGEEPVLWIATGIAAVSALLAWVVFVQFDGLPDQSFVLRFIESGSFSADWAVRLDSLSALAMVVLASLHLFVLVYAVGALRADPHFRPGEGGRPRLVAFLGLLSFAALLVVFADAVFQLLAGWLALSFAAHLTSGVYHRKPAANAASVRAYVVSALGDVSLLLGCIAVIFATDAVRYDDVFQAVPDINPGASGWWIGWSFLVLAALIKAAALPFHLFALSAVRGPAVGSAAIQTTAIFVAVFLLCRFSPILSFTDRPMTALVWLGLGTGVVSGISAAHQTSIMRAIAYGAVALAGLTLSVLGLGYYDLAFAMSIGVITSVLLIYFGAGLVDYAFDGDREINHYGGLQRALPMASFAMILGAFGATITGLTALLGFGASTAETVVFILGLGCISFAFWRLAFATFLGEPRATPETGNPKPVGGLIGGAVSALSLSSVAAWIAVFQGGAFLEPAQQDLAADGAGSIGSPSLSSGDLPEPTSWAIWLGIALVAVAFVVAWQRYARRASGAAMAQDLNPLQVAAKDGFFFERGIETWAVLPLKAMSAALASTSETKVFGGPPELLAKTIAPLLGKVGATKWAGHSLAYGVTLFIALVIALVWTLGLGEAPQ